MGSHLLRRKSDPFDGLSKVTLVELLKGWHKGGLKGGDNNNKQLCGSCGNRCG